jgi:hypothetical protein
MKRPIVFFRNAQWVAAAIVLASTWAPTPFGGNSSDPALGLWQLNEAKCRFSSSLFSVSILRSFQAANGGSTHISETRVVPDGRRVHIEYDVRYDGNEYPIFITNRETGVLEKSEDTVSFRRVDPYTVTGEFRYRGTKTSEFTRVVSKDGQTLSITVVGSDSNTTLLVYERATT